MDLYPTYEEALKAAEAEGGVVQYVPGRVYAYNVAHPPKVGDVVSKGFNGDYYPVGEVTSVSATGEKITTSSGQVFRRPRKKLVDPEGREHLRMNWRNGPFSLIKGYYDERNPSF